MWGIVCRLVIMCSDHKLITIDSIIGLNVCFTDLEASPALCCKDILKNHCIQQPVSFSIGRLANRCHRRRSGRRKAGPHVRRNSLGNTRLQRQGRGGFLTRHFNNRPSLYECDSDSINPSIPPRKKLSQSEVGRGKSGGNGSIDLSCALS